MLLFFAKKFARPLSLEWYNIARREETTPFAPERRIPSRVPSTDETTTRTRVRVNRQEEYQSLLGFGGAFTDAAGLNIKSLEPAAQELIIRSYFAPEGIRYNIGRIPMGGSDFSTRPYSYDDVEGDEAFEFWSLAFEDLEYKIPLVHLAREVSEEEVLLFGSAWSAPRWMKTNNDFIGEGRLKDEYYQLWADYFIKFLEAYSAAGLDMWGLTAGNEPTNGNIPGFSFNCMGWTPETQRKWVAENLGPTLRAAGYGKDNLTLMVFDDQRAYVETWLPTILGDPVIGEYVSGWAVHWYWNWLFGPEILDGAHADYPDFWILATEACEGSDLGEPPVSLGNWLYAESYAHNIIEDLNHWVRGWVDWNLALDLEGGPNWAANEVDAGIIVNATAGEFYKNPIFYALGHFSKFIPRGSVRLGLEVAGAVEALATSTPEGDVVVVLLNTPLAASSAIDYRSARSRLSIDDRIEMYVSLVRFDRSGAEQVVEIEDGDRFVSHTMPAKSLVTLLWSTSVE
ncbi:unnamed protein product [Darwinula stevensoni]|uniref:Glucosylceramidase n=1 Tax=Darwinula stevensoni TaxID=69355 RepID=A0A7R8X8M4_9CRUS|nr:unnamed protein product [Darwinula stevensoni]CAG0890294.1 unnamed protein product [Darwinula stevensoni]